MGDLHITSVFLPLDRYCSESNADDLEDYLADKLESSSATALPSVPTVGSMEAYKHLNNPKSLFGHSEPLPRKLRSFINPFDPKKTHRDVSDYNQRWMHVFPRDKAGVPFQVHHVIQESPDESDTFTQTSEGGEKSFSSSREEKEMDQTLSPSGGILRSKRKTELLLKASPSASVPLPSQSAGSRGKDGSAANVGGLSFGSSSIGVTKSMQFAWRDSVSVQPNNGEEFALVRRKGTDWTSLTEPSCLPITTDFFPNQTSLNRDYAENPTSLLVNSFLYGGERK